jgi:hypothetical protein
MAWKKLRESAVKPESVLEAIKDRVPADFVEINTTAFHLSFHLDFDLGRPVRR